MNKDHAFRNPTQIATNNNNTLPLREKFLKTMLKNAVFERKINFLDKKMQFFATENGEKSDSVNHIPNVL